MDFFENIVLGILQGITEFLPVSSSGHLFLVEKFFGMVPNLHFDISLHVASLIAVIFVFWDRIWALIKGVGKTLSLGKGNQEQGILVWKLFAASLVTAPVALGIEKYFETFRSVESVAITLMITGALIFLSERFRPSKEKPFTWQIALILGLVQGIAVIPGISRAGTTIAFLIFMGVERKRAAEISFLLAIPAILGALVFSIETSDFTLSFPQLLGCMAATISAIFAIQWMMKLIRQNWIWFSPYCIALGAGLLVWISLGK
ncbi:undecaprenyl-diphosphate phosphatase [Candidatus Gracilibacteria bacterium]|nr:undecaprenyl-diphosphate phosphatase [Candidatus Gracilibacteria bacterium]